MAFMTIEFYNRIKDFIHPHINDCIEHYRDRSIIALPAYHGCKTMNRNGTRKLIDYSRGHQYIFPTHKQYWRKTKDKYRRRKVHFTRYMNEYSIRCLLKIKVTSFLIIN